MTVGETGEPLSLDIGAVSLRCYLCAVLVRFCAFLKCDVCFLAVYNVFSFVLRTFSALFWAGERSAMVQLPGHHCVEFGLVRQDKAHAYLSFAVNLTALVAELSRASQCLRAIKIFSYFQHKKLC